MSKHDASKALAKFLDNLFGPRHARLPHQRVLADYVLNVSHAAERGGADIGEVYTVGTLAALFSSLHELQDERMAAVRSVARQRAPIQRHNNSRAVTPDERKRVAEQDRDLSRDYPVTAVRQRKIAERLDMKAARVRYILESPRSVARRNK